MSQGRSGSAVAGPVSLLCPGAGDPMTWEVCEQLSLCRVQELTQRRISALSEYILMWPNKILHQTFLKENSLSVSGSSAWREQLTQNGVPAGLEAAKAVLVLPRSGNPGVWSSQPLPHWEKQSALCGICKGLIKDKR